MIEGCLPGARRRCPVGCGGRMHPPPNSMRPLSAAPTGWGRLRAGFGTSRVEQFVAHDAGTQKSNNQMLQPMAHSQHVLPPRVAKARKATFVSPRDCCAPVAAALVASQRKWVTATHSFRWLRRLQLRCRWHARRRSGRMTDAFGPRTLNLASPDAPWAPPGAMWRARQ